MLLAKRPRGAATQSKGKIGTYSKRTPGESQLFLKTLSSSFANLFYIERMVFIRIVIVWNAIESGINDRARSRI